MEARASKITDMSDDLLRELAATRPEQGRVLSLYLDLDPAEFATADARASAVTSLIDGTAREIESIEDLGHEEHQGLREDVERARELLEGVVAPDQGHVDGARGLALFCCAPAGLFRPIRPKHPVATASRIAERPWLGPLAEAPPPTAACCSSTAASRACSWVGETRCTSSAS